MKDDDKNVGSQGDTEVPLNAPQDRSVEPSSSDLLQSMDAVVWAKEFMRCTGGTVDEEWAVSWFASAIMCGWDHHYWTTPEYRRLVARALGTPQLPDPNPVTYRQLYGVPNGIDLDAAVTCSCVFDAGHEATCDIVRAHDLLAAESAKTLQHDPVER